MAQNWQQTDTGATNAPAEKCYTAGTEATTPWDVECSIGGSAGSTPQTATLPAKQSYLVGYFESDEGVGVTSIPSGTWNVRLNVTTAAASGSYFDRVDICCLNSDGSVDGTIATWTGSVACDSTGTKTINVTQSSSYSCEATDLWYIQVHAFCNAHAGTTLAITPSVIIDDTITATTTHYKACAMSATGTLTADAWQTIHKASALSATGTLTADGHRVLYGVAPLSATGTLTAAGLRTVYGVAPLSATGTLTAAGHRIIYGVAPLSATGTLTADAWQEIHKAVAMSATGLLEAVGGVDTGEVFAECAMSATGTLTADAWAERFGVAPLSATGTLTAAGHRIIYGVIPMSAAGTLTAAAWQERFGVVPMSAAGLLIAAAWAERFGETAIIGTGVLTAAGYIEGQEPVGGRSRGFGDSIRGMYASQAKAGQEEVEYE